MTGLDCNILVRLALADHPANGASIAVVQAEVEHGQTLVFPSLIVAEFLHVVTDGKRFDPPLTMEEAVLWMEDLLANPSLRIIETNPASMGLTLEWMRQFKLGRKRILDTHLAAVLHTAGVQKLITSNPGDFASFGVLEVVVP
jgi:predicted nucleic acid-binding protein